MTDANAAVVWQASNAAFDGAVVVDTIGGMNVGFPGRFYANEFIGAALDPICANFGRHPCDLDGYKNSNGR